MVGRKLGLLFAAGNGLAVTAASILLYGLAKSVTHAEFQGRYYYFDQALKGAATRKVGRGRMIVEERGSTKLIKQGAKEIRKSRKFAASIARWVGAPCVALSFVSLVALISGCACYIFLTEAGLPLDRIDPKVRTDVIASCLLFIAAALLLLKFATVVRRSANRWGNLGCDSPHSLIKMLRKNQRTMSYFSLGAQLMILLKLVLFVLAYVCNKNERADVTKKKEKVDEGV